MCGILNLPINTQINNGQKHINILRKFSIYPKTSDKHFKCKVVLFILIMFLTTAENHYYKAYQTLQTISQHPGKAIGIFEIYVDWDSTGMQL